MKLGVFWGFRVLKRLGFEGFRSCKMFRAKGLGMDQLRSVAFWCIGTAGRILWWSVVRALTLNGSGSKLHFFSSCEGSGVSRLGNSRRMSGWSYYAMITQTLNLNSTPWLFQGVSVLLPCSTARTGAGRISFAACAVQSPPKLSGSGSI